MTRPSLLPSCVGRARGAPVFSLVLSAGDDSRRPGWSPWVCVALAAIVAAWCDGGYTTNLALEDVTEGKAWVTREQHSKRDAG